MALTMLDKQAEKKEKSQWPADIAAELEREAKSPNPCVGSTLLSENERTRVWIIRLAPGERIGFHRHVLDYFWTSVSGGRARQHGGRRLSFTETSHGRQLSPVLRSMQESLRELRAPPRGLRRALARVVRRPDRADARRARRRRCA